MKAEESSRFVKTTRNMLFASMSQFVIIFVNFIGRKIFLQVLDVEYLGISSVFANILSILSLAEMGVGTAIIYSLYSPIKENNTKKICALMKLYRNIYYSVGVFILIIGTLLTPFLDFFVKEMPDIPHVKFIYVLFVVQTASAYFYSYKLNYLTATQNGYLLQIYSMATSFAQLFLQSVFLIIYGNYIVYVLLSIIVPLIKNSIVSRYIDKKYPYLTNEASGLETEDKEQIKKNIFAMFLYKVSSTLSATIDTLVISIVLGVVNAGIYANYHMIISYSDKIFGSVLGAVTSSLGNFLVNNSEEEKNRIFSSLQFVYNWLAINLAVGLIVLFNPLMVVWLGEEYTFSQSTVVALAVSVTLTNFQRPCSLVRDASGLFWHGKLRPLAMSIINVCSSVFLVRWIGIIGVVIGTIVSKVATYVWYDPYIVFKYAIKGDLKRYFAKYLSQWSILIMLSLICNYLFTLIGFDGILGLVIGFFLVTVIVNAVLVLINYRTVEFKDLKRRVMGLLKK